MYILELGEKRKEFPLFIEALNELLMAKEEGTVSVDGVPLAITKPSGQVLVRLPGARDIVLAELLEIEPESVVYHDDTTAFFSDGFRVVIERCGAQACLRRLEWEKKS